MLKIQPSNTIAKMMKLLPLLAALLVAAKPGAASRLPSGRAFLPPKASSDVENDHVSNSKHSHHGSVLDIPRGGVGPLPVEDTAKVASAFCKCFDSACRPSRCQMNDRNTMRLAYFGNVSSFHKPTHIVHNSLCVMRILIHSNC